MVRSIRQTLVPIFLPHLGCDQRCIYCNQSFITGKSGKELLANQIEAGLSGRTEPVELALYSGNLFGIPADELLRLFEVLERYRPLIGSIRISTKPAPLNEEIVEILGQAGVRVIELGMPSFNDRILASLDRGYTTEEFVTSYRYLEGKGFTLGLQVMVGLPSETEADLKSAVDHLTSLRPSLLRIYPLLVLEGTRLHQLFKRGDFLPLSLDEAVERTAVLYLHALREKITVIRMGLSGSEVLQEHVVAGPYHPSFGFLVKAHVFIQAVATAWTNLGRPRSLKIRLNSNDIPHLTGHRRRHIERFKELGVQLLWETDTLDQGRFVAESEVGSIDRSITD
jgi:histone acetyltransferase (RNA polymerase elongator complex component)